MRSPTLIFGCSDGGKGRAGLADVIGIQGSSHTLTSYFECTLCLISNNNNFRAADILAHTYDGLFTQIIRKSEYIMWYPPVNTLATNESGYCTSVHNCFANRARLNIWINTETCRELFFINQEKTFNLLFVYIIKETIQTQHTQKHKILCVKLSKP